jgi:hypothetical protein
LVLHLFSVHWHGLSKKVDLHSVFYHLNHVFSLAEQYHPVIDNYKQLINVEVEAGHVEIVGYKHVAPRKLLSILQQQGMLAPTPPDRRVALERLLAKLF